MVRVAFTVALAVAILAVSGPAVEEAGVQRSDTQTRAAVDELVENARALAASNDAVRPGSEPARRTVTVRFPTAGIASAAVRSFDVGPPPNASRRSAGPAADSADGGDAEATRVTWRVAGGDRHSVDVDGLRIRPASAAVVRVAGEGTVRFVLRFVRRDGGRVVVLDR